MSLPRCFIADKKVSMRRLTNKVGPERRQKVLHHQISPVLAPDDRCSLIIFNKEGVVVVFLVGAYRRG